MGEAISDRQVVAVLRPVVRASGPVLHALRTPGRLEGLASVRVPGSVAWEEMDRERHVDWWVNRLGRLTSLVTAIPGLGGALADRLPVQDALGTAAQALLLTAMAEEHGVTDIGERVRLVAWVLFERDVDPALAAGKKEDSADEDAETAKLAGEFSQVEHRSRRITLKSAGGTLWRMGRSLLAITDELDKRPHGRFYHRAVGMLPVVGMVGDYLGERSGLKRVVRRADAWFARAA
ncbi:hypothetical protein GCM10027445_14530 [Amycolatopsis endophytica]|uniref:Uncharacterized protein n=1 Tax=Amycolatopsis endophytica TaxID=860233 RepID=A0A853B3K8_9PSEU|nr:hypothetical protein [Amycolatopsis endophytica]NYI89590.1 hypothetical protein [Amycolatopsis endophytica]